MPRDEWSLPSEADIDRLAWPLLDVARMLRLARFVLSNADITEDEVRKIAERWTAAAAAQPGKLEQLDSVAREVNEQRPVLTPEGWTIPAMPASQYRVQAEHVAAVAALLAGRRLIEMQPGMSKIALALASIGGERDRIADLNLAALAGQCCSHVVDAMFIVGRTAMRAAVEEAEARRRSEAARKGGAPQRFPDSDLVQFMAEWQAREGKRRGAVKAASRHFGVTDKAIQLRLKSIREKQEAAR